MSEATLPIPGEDALDAFVVAPEGDAARTPILVVHGAFEPNDGIHDVGRRLARHGFVAVSPFLREAAALRPRLTNEDLVRLVASASAFARARCAPANAQASPPPPPVAVGMIGFALGGFVAFLAACRAQVAAAVGLYPRGLVRPIRGLSIAPLVGEVRAGAAPLLGLFGAQDERVRPRDLAQIRARLTACRVPHELVVYPHARPGFFSPERAEYRSDAADDAWSRALRWLDRIRESARPPPPMPGSDVRALRRS
jgi:carboxymethylenebutenolidase